MTLHGGKQIDTYNCIAVEACIFVEVGTAIKDLEAMKIPVMEELFFTKYLRIVRSIPDERFARIELRSSMLEMYGGAKKPNTGRSLLRKYKTYVGAIRKFALHFPGIKSMSKLPSGTTQLSQMKGPVVAKLWKAVNPVSSSDSVMQILNSSLIFAYFLTRTWRESTTITLSRFWRKYLTTGGCHM